jgi:hypothetical protein
MGCFVSLCRSRHTADDYGQFVLRAKGDDKDSLIDRGLSGHDDPAFQLATAPTPLLKGINFVPIDDDSDPSVDDEAIEEFIQCDDDKD